MSYVVQIWEQPVDLPMPDNASDIWRMIGGLHKRSVGPNPKFLELGRQLVALYPETEEEGTFWLDGVDGKTEGAVWNLGLYCGDRLDEVQATLAARATALGLNVAAEGGGDLYLGDGRVYTVHDLPRAPPEPPASVAPPLASVAAGPAPTPVGPAVDSPAAPAPAAAPSPDVAALTAKAERGDRDARFDLGCRYKTGDGVPQSDTEALRWWGLAAEQGMPDAQFNLGVAHFFGEGVAQDEKKAYQLYGQAADGGHPEAIYSLGVMHMQGKTVPKDPIAAKALFLHARKRGSQNAQEPVYEPGELARVMAFVAMFGDGGKYRKVLAGGALAPRPARPERPPVAKSEPTAPTSSPTGWHLGHMALILGAISLPTLLLLASRSEPEMMRMLAALFSLAAAYGVWRSAGDLEFPGPKKVAIALLALVPGIGTFASIYMLVRVFRARRR